MRNKTCRYCNGPLMRVDYYGEELIGSIESNRWGYPGDKKLTMELQEHDLEELRANGRHTRERRFWRPLS